MNPTLTKHQKFYAVLFSIILGIIALLCILALIFVQKNTQTASTALIYQNGTLIRTIPLDSATSSYQFQIDGSDGAYNLIEVRSGTIGIIEASCPDHVCMDMGFRSHSMLPITCLPNRLVILFSEETTSSDTPDILTY